MNIQTDLWSKVNSQEGNINVPLVCDKDGSLSMDKGNMPEKFTKASAYLFWEKSSSCSTA